MGQYVRTFDWSATTLGPITGWPQSLRSAVGIALRSPAPIVLLWGDEGYMIYNDAYAQFAAGRHPQLLGSRVREGWPEVADFNDHVMRVCLAGGTLTYQDQELILNRTGTPQPVWVDLAYSPLPDESGTPAGVIAIVVETTERVLAQRRAARQQDRQRMLLARMPGFVVDMRGPEHRFEYVNEAFGALVGYREVFGKTVREAFPELQGQGFFEMLDAVYASGERVISRDAEVKFSGDAEPRYVDQIYEPIRDERGEITGIFAGGYDVTERHRTAAALLERERELQRVNESLERRVQERTRELTESMDFARLALTSIGGVGVWTYEVASDSFICDAAIARLYGVDPVQAPIRVSTTDFLRNVHPDDRPLVDATMASGLKNRGDLELEYRLVQSDGSIRWVLSRGHTYFDDAGNAVRRTGVGVDLTRQRVMEEQLRQSQKMEAVGQLTGGLAHDFNNLLAGISGSLEVVRALLAQGKTELLGRYVTAALGATKRAAALTHRLLAFSRRQTLDPKPTDVNRLIQDMEDLIRRSVGPQISIEVVGAAGLWATLVDPNQLENALLNLCINARDAMPEGGRITIETANRWLDERAAAERDLPAGQYISLCVTDTGTGMTSEVIQRAFDPFFTTKPIGEGTGLGLSMIYGFARQSGGQIRIYSEVGTGTTMCLYLPRHLGPAESGVSDIERPAPVAGSGEVVLVVDDEPTIRMLIADVLEASGYVGLEATDGPGAMKLLQGTGKIDLLITDVGLPGGINGRQIADAARVSRPDLKVLFITGYAENAVIGSGPLAAGMELMTKPFAMEDLARRIRRIIEGA